MGMSQRSSPEMCQKVKREARAGAQMLSIVPKMYKTSYKMQKTTELEPLWRKMTMKRQENGQVATWALPKCWRKTIWDTWEKVRSASLQASSFQSIRPFSISLWKTRTSLQMSGARTISTWNHDSYLRLTNNTKQQIPKAQPSSITSRYQQI